MKLCIHTALHPYINFSRNFNKKLLLKYAFKASGTKLPPQGGSWVGLALEAYFTNKIHSNILSKIM